jgi:hypothetical protein
MAEVTAASFPITLAGKEYRLSPLSDRDNSELTNWLRASFIQMARDSLPGNATQQERDETLAVAMREARGISWFSREGAKVMRSLEGVARVVWQSLRKEHPELTPEQVREMLVDERTIDHALAVWREINVGNAVKETTQPGSPKAASRRLRRKRSTRS